MWETSEICFFGDTSLFSCEHMTNNALERHNNELYDLLGRHPHPNPYYFMACVRTALQTNQKQLAWVESGDYVEVRSRDARKSALKRQRLKVQFLNRLKRARNEHDTRRAILYHITGRTPDLQCIFGNHLKPELSRPGGPIVRPQVCNSNTEFLLVWRFYPN